MSADILGAPLELAHLTLLVVEQILQLLYPTQSGGKLIAIAEHRLNLPKRAVLRFDLEVQLLQLMQQL